ncbi:Periplasmic binding protein [Sterolibacterium denitrificans]|uniref:Periplasmic binding protein n=1 Tax=Sterolibacterium denitrificans TaxID=157592 RepID=A0A7Z7HSB2_9PROT|nr:ABC transporter substrate-binding protein [Sterolibacterium denitrificans]SMB28657.1 Periplasmic binding protein [Sterolibacterium denitrificans]
MPHAYEKTHFRRLALALCLWGVCQTAAAAAEASPGCTVNARTQSTQSIVDMAGRTVVLPREVKRIATVGPVPVINGYLFALGAGERIVNGLPSRFTQSDRWHLQTAIAPHLAGQPVLQGQTGSDVSLEVLVKLAPDMVITMETPRIKTLAAAKAPIVYLEWGNAADIRRNMALLGCVLDRTAMSEAYLRYFDATLARVRAALAGVAPADRPRVLYFNPHTMTTPLAIANWWIEEAGGRSVTAAMARGGTAHYSHEQVLLWNPQVLIVSSPEQATAILRDERFARIDAVRHARVHVMPTGIHSWGQRTVEQPLSVLWAAQRFHPERFARLDMAGEVRAFYRDFFGSELSSAQAREILEGASRDGMPGRRSNEK